MSESRAPAWRALVPESRVASKASMMSESEEPKSSRSRRCDDVSDRGRWWVGSRWSWARREAGPNDRRVGTDAEWGLT